MTHEREQGSCDFFRVGLGIDHLNQVTRDPDLYPGWSPALADSMVESTERYIASILWEHEGTFEALFTSNHGYVDGRLAEVYGVSIPEPEPLATMERSPLEQWVAQQFGDGDSLGGSWHRVDLDPTQRLGLLSQPSVLAAHAHYDSTSVVHRGLLVLEALLCQEMPAPPDDVILTLPPVSDDMTTRERYARHEVDPACGSCHSLIDPVGFAFEHYDAIGQWREYDGNYSVDATGLLTNTLDVDGEFYGTDGLARRVINSPTARACFAQNVYRYTFGKQNPNRAVRHKPLGAASTPQTHTYLMYFGP